MALWIDTLIERLEKLADFGHDKRNGCVLRHVTRLMGAPGASAAQAGGNEAAAWAESKSWYDVVGNEKVTVRDLRAWRAQAVLEDIAQVAETVVFHDVSEMDYSRHNAKHGRMEIGDHHGKGYEYHPCVAWDARANRFLGVLHDTLIFEGGPDDSDVVDYNGDPALDVLDDEARGRLPFNHRHQVAMHIRYLAQLVPDRKLIHVADREFDDTLAMAAARKAGHDFVFRAVGNRTVRVREGEKLVSRPMAKIVETLPMRPYKDIGIDARGHAVYGQTKPARIAKLSIGACAVQINRPATRCKRRGRIKLDAPLEVNLLVIRELNPPPGQAPLCWMLFTSLPIETHEQCAWAALLYEMRWRIEEYFKLLKSGFTIEQTHFTQPEHIAKLLVFYSLAAMALLVIKPELGLPATGPLDHDSYVKVRYAMRHPDDPDLDPKLSLFALVLRCGGWLGRKTDPIGPTILMRGMLQLTATVRLARQFPELLTAIANTHGADGANAYTW